METNQSWEKEFVRDFPEFSDERGAQGTLGTPEEITEFIHKVEQSALQRGRESALDEIERLGWYPNDAKAVMHILPETLRALRGTPPEETNGK